MLYYCHNDSIISNNDNNNDDNDNDNDNYNNHNDNNSSNNNNNNMYYNNHNVICIQGFQMIIVMIYNVDNQIANVTIY